MTEPGIDGVATGNWNIAMIFLIMQKIICPKQKKNCLIWDDITEKINKLWPKIPTERFNEMEGFWSMGRNVYVLLFLHR